VTPAQRGQRVLQKAGVSSMLQRTPRWMEERGCGYCLRLDREDLEQAVAVLRREQVSFSKIYIMVDGKPEEMQL
jgi:hypothetical protein